MIITALTREQLLTVLPKGGTIAEIGVLRGDFARQIRAVVEPETLHLIDPWGQNDSSYREARIAKLLNDYDTVVTLFEQDIASGRVVLHREFSTVAATTFPDQTFDWVYVDARHNYDNALADLQAFKPKIKPDGFILGHDFSTYRKPRAFGVVPAVREFTKDGEFELVLITNETNPSYLLGRASNGTTLPALRTAVLSHEASAPVQVSNALLDRFGQTEVVSAGGEMRQVITFR